MVNGIDGISIFDLCRKPFRYDFGVKVSFLNCLFFHYPKGVCLDFKRKMETFFLECRREFLVLIRS